jgi:RimJ/RimL family protein N-acetyltransferase
MYTRTGGGMLMKYREKLTIRTLKITDVIKFYKTYKKLSEETKHYFHPFPESFRGVFTVWVPLSLSSVKIFRKILEYMKPHFVYSAVVCDYQNEIIGFAFIKHTRIKHVGNLGIVVREDFQGMGIGSKLMNSLIALARREGLRKICLMVLVDNHRAIKLYKKFGFKITRFIKEGDIYKGKRYDSMEMCLDL